MAFEPLKPGDVVSFKSHYLPNTDVVYGRGYFFGKDGIWEFNAEDPVAVRITDAHIEVERE